MPFLYQNLESWTPPPNNYWTFNQRIDPQSFRKKFHKDFLIFSSALFVKIMFPSAFFWAMAVLWNFCLCKAWNIVKIIEKLVVKHYQSFQGWKGSSKWLQKNQRNCFRRFCGIILEFQQNQKPLKLIQYMQAKTCSLRCVKFGSSLCISGSGKEPNTIWNPPLLHNDKNDAERWGGNLTDSVPLCLQTCGVFILRHWRPWCRASEDWKVPAGPQGDNAPVQIYSGQNAFRAGWWCWPYNSFLQGG